MEILVEFHVSETHRKVIVWGLYWGVTKSQASVLESVAPTSSLCSCFSSVPWRQGRASDSFSKGASETLSPDSTICSVLTHVLIFQKLFMKKKNTVCVHTGATNRPVRSEGHWWQRSSGD